MRKQYDPAMHTAEHILNQTMVRVFDCGRCFSAHIEKKKSKCDYHFDRPLTKEEVRGIEDQVNEVIQSNLSVTEEYVSREAAEKEFNLKRLPADVGDKIRIVRVGRYDACPCIGPHVDSTGEVGGFQISSTTYEAGVLRIRFKLQTGGGESFTDEA